MNTLEHQPQPVLEIDKHIGYKRAPELGPGQIVGGHFEVEGRVVEGDSVVLGGQADIYRAKFLDSEQHAIIKVQRDMSADNYVSHFALEAEINKALARKTNGVPGFIDGGIDFDDKGMPFYWIALEEMKTSLDREIKRRSIEGKPLEAESIANIFAPSLGAVALMHDELNVAHVDLKPSNFFIAKDGTGRIGDFGAVSAARKVNITALKEYNMPLNVVTQPLSESDLLYGTYDFMPPEALSGGEVDLKQADSYAAGLTIHMAVGGKRPEETLVLSGGKMKSVRAVPQVELYDNARVPRSLANLVLSLTDPNPANRIPMREAAAELERI